MTFADLVPRDAVFVDANIFVYHFAPDPALQGPCGQFLQRIENQEIQGFTSQVAQAPGRLRSVGASPANESRWRSRKCPKIRK